MSVIGKQITPAFKPIGLTDDNWPATVGLFTGLFAKEAVVGTLDALYSEPVDATTKGAPDIVAAAGEAVASIATNGRDLLASLTDPLGVSIGDVADRDAVAAEQGVKTSTLTNMASLFGSQFAAFCYLVFILLYAPCVATLGTIAKEAGWRWMMLVFAWCTSLGYMTASSIYQLGTFAAHPVFSLLWIAGCALVLGVIVQGLKLLRIESKPDNLIEVVQLNADSSSNDWRNVGDGFPRAWN